MEWSGEGDRMRLGSEGERLIRCEGRDSEILDLDRRWVYGRELK